MRASRRTNCARANCRLHANCLSPSSSSSLASFWQPLSPVRVEVTSGKVAPGAIGQREHKSAPAQLCRAQIDVIESVWRLCACTHTCICVPYCLVMHAHMRIRARARTITQHDARRTCVRRVCQGRA